MKTLLTFFSPENKFDLEYNDTRMVETQIENSLNFWKAKDIIFATNFPYEHKGVKSTVLEDDLYCEFEPKTSKINAIISLLEKGIIKELTWYHGLDAFQLAPINVSLDRDLGLTNYGYKPSWNSDSLFFNPGSLDIFKWIKEVAYKHKINEEQALWRLTQKNYNNINYRYRILNNTYNIGMRKTDYVISLSERPLKVAHFPPHWKDTYEQFKPILTDELIKLIDEKFYNSKSQS